MKQSFLILSFLLSVAGSASSCSKNDNIPESKVESNDTMIGIKIKITAGSKTLSATLADNNAAKAFQERLPLTVNMTELNGNEKYFDFTQSLPANSSNPGNIQNGDLMLYGSRTLVLFYKTFSTSYSYTRLGRIDDPSGLEATLGSDNVTVKFDLE